MINFKLSFDFPKNRMPFGLIRIHFIPCELFRILIASNVKREIQRKKNRAWYLQVESERVQKEIEKDEYFCKIAKYRERYE